MINFDTVQYTFHTTLDPTHSQPRMYITGRIALEASVSVSPEARAASTGVVEESQTAIYRMLREQVYGDVYRRVAEATSCIEEVIRELRTQGSLDVIAESADRAAQILDELLEEL